MKNKLLYCSLALAVLPMAVSIGHGDIDAAIASTYHPNHPTVWHIQSPLTTDYVKVKNDGDTGICIEGLTYSSSSDRYGDSDPSLTKTYRKPVTAVNYEKVKVDGLSLSIVVRNATAATGASGDLGDFFGFFFYSSISSYASLPSSATNFTLFASPYTSQSRFVTQTKQTNNGYATFNATPIHYQQPDTSSGQGLAGSVVFTPVSYTMSGKTYYRAGATFTIVSYNSSWYKFEIGAYPDCGTLWTNNANYDSNTKKSTYYIPKSKISGVLDSNGKTYLGVFGCGASTFGYLYDLSENNSLASSSSLVDNVTPASNVEATISDANENNNMNVLWISISTISVALFAVLSYIKMRKSING